MAEGGAGGLGAGLMALSAVDAILLKMRKKQRLSRVV
jgi:hypothetical protein